MPNNLKEINKLIRYNILTSSTAAGSGHPSSSLSATELMSTLFFGLPGRSSGKAKAGGFFKYDIKHPDNIHNDRLIFSKGHASPLFYSLWAAVEGSSITNKELKTFRKFSSRLEGHPSTRLPYTEAATGSLGHGLSIGVGMALNAKYDRLDYTTYVLLGDSEMSEGSNWEAMQIAAYYKLNNLVGIIDVNRLGQRGETMQGYDLDNFAGKAAAFGWEAIVIDGHNLKQIQRAFSRTLKSKTKPVMIIAKTVKGKGVSWLEDKNGWHGKALKEADYEKAIEELGVADMDIKGVLAQPGKKSVKSVKSVKSLGFSKYSVGEEIATRQAYGDAIAELAKSNKQVIVLDAEVGNSTYAETVKERNPRQFFEMYIAEQNMVGAASGFSARGKMPFVSTFAAFFTRAADQIRMAQYSKSNIKFVGSHAGVSIGEDGASQMGLEDISLFRSVNDSIVLYPSDAVSTRACVELAARHKGVSYLRTTRAKTEVLYNNKEKFQIGRSKTLKEDRNDVVTIIAAGITLHEALKACKELKNQKIKVRIVDMYSVKPIDTAVIKKACADTKALIVVEDHYRAGGLYEAICASGAVSCPAYSLAVAKMPSSGAPEELMRYENIDAQAIIKKVKEII